MKVKITDNSQEVIAAKDQAVKRALAEIALAMEDNAKLEVTTAVYDTPESPTYVRTGALRNSISHESDDDTAYVGTNLEYAPYVELGTSNMVERPFIRPAVENHLKEYQEILEEHLRG